MAAVTKRRITTVDVANLANVSQRTAARVFASPELVAEDTRRAVEAAAAELGYVPNAIARSLKSQRSGIVGVVVPSSGQYYHEVVRHLARALARVGEQLLVFSFDSADVDDTIAAVRGYQLDGLVLASATVPGDLLERAREGRRLVSFNDPAPHEGIPSVSVDNEAGVAALVDHVAGLGARSITFVNGLRAAATNKLRRSTSRRRAQVLGLTWTEVDGRAFTYDGGRRAGRALLAGGLPDVAMAASDELAFGIIDELRSGGAHVGHDIKVTGFDGLAQASWRAYDLTTIEQPLDSLIDETVRLVLPGRVETPPRITAPGIVRIRSSTTGHPLG